VREGGRGEEGLLEMNINCCSSENSNSSIPERGREGSEEYERCSPGSAEEQLERSSEEEGEMYSRNAP
jgi:hypothetical protein